MARYKSVADMFRNRVKQTPDREAFSYRNDGGWEHLTWKQTEDRVRALALGLRDLGVQDEQRVAILCSTRIEWLLADLAVMYAGAATTTIYPSSTDKECHYILQDSESVVVFAEDDAQVEKIAKGRANLPNVKAVVNIDGKGGHGGWVITLADLEAKGKALDKSQPKLLDEVIDRITPDKLATLIYTSGTTGMPKGVELLNDCWLFTGEALEELNILSADDKQFLWLPLSHSFGKVLETIVIHLGIPTAVDGEIPRIVDNCSVVQPTFMGAAPRIFEKAYNKIVNGAKEAGGAKWAIFKWAAATGLQVSKLRQEGKEPSGFLGFKYKIADKLVFSKIRARFGGKIRFFISGSAPLNREIAEFFHGAGLTILEGYGLTESSAASFVNRPESNKFGTVGKPLPGTQVRIDPETGEIQFKSRGIMRGYFNKPQETAETLDSEGFLHTGDKGELDADGHLRITDRIKNLIKTSGGKYVAPAALEGAFKARCPLASQILVHGDGRNYCTALVTMDEEAVKNWAQQQGLGDKSLEELAEHPTLVAEFKKAMDEVNAGRASFETIKQFKILPHDFTVDGGELTPSLKVKRKVVETKYKKDLDGFYKDSMAQL